MYELNLSNKNILNKLNFQANITAPNVIIIMD